MTKLFIKNNHRNELLLFLKSFKSSKWNEKGSIIQINVTHLGTRQSTTALWVYNLVKAIRNEHTAAKSK